MLKLSGVITALVTPFKKDLSVDYGALEVLIKRQVSSNIDGLVVLGTTGEAFSLKQEEKIKIISFCVDKAKEKTAIIVGAGSNNTDEACSNQKLIEDLGANASMHVTPWYNKPTQEGLFRHFEKISSISRIPILMYNVPSRTGVDLKHDTLFKIIRSCENILGIKDANTDMLRMQTILIEMKALKSPFFYLTGDDLSFLNTLVSGGNGVVSVLSNFLPGAFVDLFDNFNRKNLGKAIDIQFSLNNWFNLSSIYQNPILIKTVLNMMGLIELSFRNPLCSLESSDIVFVRKKLEGLLNEM